MKRGAIVCRISSRHTRRYRAMIRGAAKRLSVIVWACGRVNQAQTVMERLESAKRIRNSALEPTQHAGAHSREDRSPGPRLAKQFVQAMATP